MKSVTKRTPQIIRFFCECGDIWFQLGTLIVSLVGVILALEQINKPFVKVSVIVLFITFAFYSHLVRCPGKVSCI